MTEQIMTPEEVNEFYLKQRRRVERSGGAEAVAEWELAVIQKLLARREARLLAEPK